MSSARASRKPLTPDERAPLTEIRPPSVPADLPAEGVVLGAMLLSSEAVAIAAEALTPEDFLSPRHQVTFAGAMSLYERSRPVDPVTLAGATKALGSSIDVDWLTFLSYNTPAIAHIEAYVAAIKEASVRRQVIRAAQRATELAYDPTLAFEDLLDHAEEAIYSAAAPGRKGHTAWRIRPALDATITELEERIAAGREVSGVATGIPALDDLILGMQPGQLVVLGARPKTGKSMFATQISVAAAQSGKRVLFFSLEMSRSEIVQRVIASSDPEIPMRAMRSAELSGRQMARLRALRPVFDVLPITLDDDPSPSVLTIRSRCRRAASSDGLDLVIVDYLQLVPSAQPAGRRDMRYLEIGEITRALKVTAKELGIPVLALSQLRRQNRDSDDKRPTLADLRESGNIEQDADAILLLHREHSGSSAQVFVTQRQGKEGVVDLSWDERTMRFMPAGREADNNDAF